MYQNNYPEPFHTFCTWLHKHVTTTTSEHPFACVLSTIGLDGYPNARNLALKEVKAPYFIITGSTHSRKAKEINTNPKVALTFWWEESNRQIRVQGTASPINEETAQFYFNNRSRISQLISSISKQGAPLDAIEDLKKNIEAYEQQLGETAVPCPPDWGGYQIQPKRIEFLEFKTSRLHRRTLYMEENDHWSVSLLQP